MALSEDELAVIIAQGTQSAFWELFLKPALAERARQAFRSLVSSSSESDDIKRGKFKAYEEILKLPETILEEMKVEARRKALVDEAEEMANFRAEHGFRTPYKATETDGQPV